MDYGSASRRRSSECWVLPSCPAEELLINAADPLRLFLVGPLFLLLLTGCLATLALAAGALGRLDTLLRLGTRAAARLEMDRTIPVLWGLAAGLGVFLLAAVLFNTKVLALLGLAVLVIGFSIAALGLAAAALFVGTRLADAFTSLEADTFSVLRAGLWTLTLASAVPFAGWLLVVLALAAGIGAVLETLVVRTPPPETR